MDARSIKRPSTVSKLLVATTFTFLGAIVLGVL